VPTGRARLSQLVMAARDATVGRLRTSGYSQPRTKEGLELVRESSSWLAMRLLEASGRLDLTNMP
jgi:hypothetical protein